MQPIFPTGIWDGTTPNRENKEQVKSPDAHDASRIISEIISIEKFLKENLICDLQTLKGERGERGEPGIPGERGPIGPKGDTGPIGPKGDRGEIGPVGPQGETGLAGAVGPAGERGERGERGETGERGAQGVRGPRGETLKFTCTVNDSQLVTHGLGTQDVCISVYADNRLVTDHYTITLIDNNRVNVQFDSAFYKTLYLVIIG